MFQTILYLNNDNCQTSSLQKSFFFWYLLLERIRYPKCTEIRFLEISQKIEFKASLYRFVIFFGKFLSYLNNVFHSGVKIWQIEEKPCSIYLLNIFRLISDTGISDFRYMQWTQSIDNNMVWLKKKYIWCLKNYLETIFSYY